jgi:hypothetical protein
MKHSLSSQRFWNNLSILDCNKIESIEDQNISKIVNGYNIISSYLLFVNSNFITHIDTDHPSFLAKRGNSK